MEWRAFTALLQRISPVAELVDVGTGGGKAYKQIAELSDQITERRLRIEQLGPRGERIENPDYRVVPFLALASYVEKRGGLVLVLNPPFKPYLLQLAEKGNFTKSRAAELKHLKGGYAHKLHWLLSEYRAFGTRTFTLPELRFRLGIKDNEYTDRFDNFKAKVLDPAKRALAKTDLAFELEIIRKGRAVQQVRFAFNASPLVLIESADGEALTMPPAPPAPWVPPPLTLGVSAEGCELIKRHLAEGTVPDGLPGVRHGRAAEAAQVAGAPADRLPGQMHHG